MTVTTADFETGTNGNAIATSDTGSATAWDAVVTSGSIVYDNTHAYKSLACKIVSNGSGPAYLGWSTALGSFSSGTLYARLYVYLTAYPASGNNILLYYGKGGFTTGTRAGWVDVNSTGNLRIQPSSGTPVSTTNVLTLNQWVRIEFKMPIGTNQQFEVKLYNNADSTTATETLTSSASFGSGTGIDHFAAGDISALSLTWWQDNVVAGATAGYPGPFPVSTTAPTVSGSAPVGSTLTCDGGTWNGGASFTLAYQWTRDGSNIGSATSSSYTTVSADSGHAIGCKVTATGQVATNENATQASSNTITATSSSSSSFSGADPSKTASAMTVLGL